MTRIRQVDTGVLIAPRRGEAPDPPEGYEAAPGDPYVFLKILPDCTDREIKTVNKACCGPTERVYCHDQDGYVMRSDCHECKGDTTPYVHPEPEPEEILEINESPVSEIPANPEPESKEEDPWQSSQTCETCA